MLRPPSQPLRRRSRWSGAGRLRLLRPGLGIRHGDRVPGVHHRPGAIPWGPIPGHSRVVRLDDPAPVPAPHLGGSGPGARWADEDPSGGRPLLSRSGSCRSWLPSEPKCRWLRRTIPSAPSSALAWRPGGRPRRHQPAGFNGHRRDADEDRMGGSWRRGRRAALPVLLWESDGSLSRLWPWVRWFRGSRCSFSSSSLDVAREQPLPMTSTSVPTPWPVRPGKAQ